MISPKFMNSIYHSSLKHWHVTAKRVTPKLCHPLHKSLVGTLPSYIQDSKQFLQLFESLLPLSEIAILVTTDVTLFTLTCHMMRPYKMYYNTWNCMPANYPQVLQATTELVYYLKPSWRTTAFYLQIGIFLHLVGKPMGAKATPNIKNGSLQRIHLGKPLSG